MNCKIILKASSQLASQLGLKEDTVFDSKEALVAYMNESSQQNTLQKSVQGIAGVTKLLSARVSNINAGIQQDATHSTENSNVILPSQMFNAFTFKGYSQREVNEIYGAIADIAVKGLSDTFFTNLDGNKSEGENIDFSELVRDILDNDSSEAKEKMLRAYREILIKKGSMGDTFGLFEVLSQTFDAMDMPIDNPHMFNTAVSELANKFTKEAIKIKFDGQFAVLKPGAGSQQVYEVTGGIMPYKDGMSVKYRPVVNTEVVTRDRALEWAKYNNIDINTLAPRNLKGQYINLVDSAGNKTQLSLSEGEQLIPEAKALAEAKSIIGKYKVMSALTDSDYDKNYNSFIKEINALPEDSGVKRFIQRYIDALPESKAKKDILKGKPLLKIFTYLNPEASYFPENGKTSQSGDMAKLLYLGKINTLGKVLTHELNRFMTEASEGRIPQSLQGETLNDSTGHKIEVSRAEVIVDLTARDKFFIREGDDIGDINQDFFYNRLVERSGLNTVFHGADRMLRSGQQRIFFHYGIAPAKYNDNISDQAEYDRNENVVNVYGTPEAGNANKILFSLKGQTSVRTIDGNMHIFLNQDKGQTGSDIQKLIQGDKDSNYNRVKAYLGSQYSIKEEDLSKVSEETRAESRGVLQVQATKMYNSWNKYLDVIGTRIPGQHYQSFQGLRIVGFTTGNKIFVPNEVTMLAGSDFDIDKMNMIYYSIDKNGLLAGWHQAFDHSTRENLEASMRLPLPINRKRNDFKAEYILGEAIDNVIEFPETFEIENVQHLAWLYDQLKSGKKLGNNEYDDMVAEILEGYDDTKQYKLNPKGINNFTISRANSVINNTKNYPLLQKPVSMASPQLMGSMSQEGKEAKLRTKEQPSSMVFGKIDNMVGRDMIGIVASTGLKGFSAMTAVYNKSLMDLSVLASKLTKLRSIPINNEQEAEVVRIKETQLNKEISEITVGFPREFSVANLNYENVSPETLNLIKPRFKTNSNEELDIAKQYIIQNMMEGLSDDAAEIESELLSAATDNAKELILSKIRATPEFGTIYTALIAQGVPFWNIVKTMTNPATDFYLKHFDREAFKAKHVNFDSVLVDIDNAKNGTPSKKTKAFKNLKANNFELVANTLRDSDGSAISVKSLNEFKDLLTQGKAVQILGKYLGINQGIKSKAYEIYSFTKTIESYMLDAHGLEFSFTKFLNSLNSDKVYANEMIDMSSNGAFNLLYVLSRATNFEKQLQGFNVTNQILRESTYKLNAAYAITNKLTGYVLSDGKALNEEQFNEVQKFIDNNVLLQFFKNETKTNSDPATRPVFYDGDTRIELTNKEGRKLFTEWVHDKFIPMIKNMPDFENNEFIRDLTYETVRDTLYSEPVQTVRMTYDTTNAISPETKSKEDNYKFSLNQLKFAYDTDPSNPTVNNLFNVLFWYNTLVNKGGTGKYSWAKMQNELIMNDANHPFQRLAQLQGSLGKDTSVSYVTNNPDVITVNGIDFNVKDLVTYHNVTGETTRILESKEDEATRNSANGDFSDDDEYSVEDYDNNFDDDEQSGNYIPLARIVRSTRKGETGTRVIFKRGSASETINVQDPSLIIPYDLSATNVENEDNQIAPADSARAIRELGSRFKELNPNVDIQYPTKRQIIQLSNSQNYDYTRAKAFIINGQVNINLNKASLSDVVHEYGHLFLHSLKYESLESYNALIQLSTNHERFNEIKDVYNKLEGDDLNEEVFVTLFGEAMKNNLGSDYDGKELMTNFADYTKEKLNTLLNKEVGTIVDLSPKEVMNLSLEDAINLMGDTIMKNRIDNLFDGPLGFKREIQKLKDDLFERGLITEHCG